jgi:PII-like signaling protein
MHLTGPGLRLMIYIGETDHWHGRPLYDALVVRAREMGLAGATVTRGLEGYGAHSRLHTAKVLRLSENLPIIVELVDREDRIRAFVAACDEMIGEGLVTIEPVEILKYAATVVEKPKD